MRRIRFREDQSGQTIFFMLAALLTIVSFTLVTIHYGLRYREEIRLQRAADAAAISGAQWEARTYNLLSGMNQGMLIFLTVCLTAIILAVLATLTEVGVVAVDALIETAQKTWDAAVALSDLEKTVVKLAPLIVIGQTVDAGTQNGVKTVIPFPYHPEALGGSHDSETTLSLHVEPGNFAALLKKIIGMLPATLQKTFENPIAKNLIDALLQEIATETPEPMELDDDFAARSKAGVFVWHGRLVPAELIGRDPRNIATAQARAFQPDAAPGAEDLWTMNWHARLVPVDFTKDFPGPLLPRRD